MATERRNISVFPTAEGGRLLTRRSDAGAPVPLPFAAAINRVAQAVINDLPFDELMNEIVASAIRAFDAEIGLARGISADGSNFVVVSAVGPAPLSIGGLLGSYSVISESALESAPGSTTVIDLRAESDVAELTSNERWELDHVGGRHALIVPLHAAGQLVGRLDLIRTSAEPFPLEARRHILPFAAFAATALLDRQLHHASEERHVYKTVVRLHESVEQLADPETILQAVVELIVREPGCARCYAMLWNPERSEFVPTAVAGLEPHLVDILKLIALSPQVVPAFDQMVHSSRPLVIADATKSTLLPASLVRALGIRAAMIVPLRGRRHQTMGVLLLDQTDETIQFSERQVSMMASMAQHLSTLIENAILFEEIRTASDSMGIINEIAIQLAMLTDEASLFRQLYYQVASVLDASRFAMALLSNEERMLDARVAIDGEIAPEPLHIPLGEDTLSAAILSGRVDISGVRSADDQTSWLPGGEPEEQAHSHLTVPITIGRNVIGAMSIQSAFRNAYGPRDKELLTAIALHTGIALENARLYRLVQSRGNRRAVVLDEVIHRQEAERKELVDTIHDDTLQTLAACLYRLDQAKVAVEKLDREAQAIVQLSDVRESLADNIDRLRRRIFALRPSTLDRLGLEPALRELLTRLRREYSIDTDLDVELASRLSAEDETLVYRMVQEAIEYIVMSGGATYAGVTIREVGGNVTLKLVDDGAHPELSGHDDAPAGHVGLLALVERADLAGGNLRVARRTGGGSIMQIALPVTNRSDSSSSTDLSGGDGVSYAGD